VLGSEQAPTLAEQTPDQTTWQAQRDTLGPPFDAERVTLAQLRQIRKDPMVAFGLHYMKVPLVRAEWHIEAYDNNGPNPQISAFLDACLRGIYATLIFQRELCKDFGFQGIVKRFIFQNPGGTWSDPTATDPAKAQQPAWNEGNVNPIIYKNPVALRPEQTTPQFDDKTGEFTGMAYEVPPAQRNKASGFKASSQKGNQSVRQIDIWHSYWAVNQKNEEHGSMYGYPRIGFARDYWWAYRFLFMMSNRAYERLAIPPVLAYHPEGSTLVDAETGETRPNWEIALEAAERIRANAVAAVPSTMATAGLDSSATQREWDFKFMETPWESLKVFDDRFNYINIMKLRSIWVPDLAFIGGNQSGGNTGGNIAEQMAEMLTESLELDMAEIDDEINRLWLPQLLTLNFPDFINNGGRAKKVSHGFRKEDIEFYKQVLQLIGQSNPNAFSMVDLVEIFRRSGTPLKTPAQLAADQALMIQQQANAQPPGVTPTANGIGIIRNPAVNPGFQAGGSAPGVTANGNNNSAMGFSDEPHVTPMMYVAGRELIELSEIDDFVAGLPSTYHYSDRTIRSLMLQLRRLWLGYYRNLYPEFAGHVATAKLEPADVNLDDDEFRSVNVESIIMMFADKKPDKIIAMTKKAATKLANTLLATWGDESEKMQQLREKSEALLRRIAERAQDLEKSRSRIDTEWDDKQLDDWLARQSARLIKLTHQTVRNELRDFLVKQMQDGLTADEIADQVRAHFSGFEGHKADRVARSETRDAVNAATLISAEANGIKYVRATDGIEHDEECKRRDNTLFTVKEAWKEMWKEHPYGVLGFVPIARANFSIVYVHEMPDDAPEGATAYFDNDTSTAFIMFDADGTDEYLTELGGWLIAHP
jgi:hypothetical protein